ncbi:MAG: TetR/AcrR family transcriptional regulator [Oleispira sp.]|nr:TetR/AcrR family transcriptional regulator [Oleispira sp.]
MGRPKSYDQDQILKKVMMKFWQLGFAETSISDLEAATSLNRYSLYKGFGDKEVLFEKALNYYQEHTITLLLAPLIDNTPSLESLNKFFQQLNGMLKSRYGAYGCLIQNSQKEGISKNKVVKQQGIKLWQQQYKLFSACLEDKSCQLPFDKEDAVQLLLAQAQAQISLARAKAPHAVLDKQHQAIKSLIATWQV